MGDIINPYGKEILTVETQWLGKTLSFEINRLGFRSTASVLVKYGETVVLGTAMVSPERLSHFDYFPLSINYEEKMYAAGKVSGSRFIKREGRPSDDAILIGRLIDRPLRPLWPKGYRHEVQGVATILSMDPDFRPDMIAMIAMSVAFSLTGAPFDGPIAGLRVAQIDGEFKAFVSNDEYDNGALDLVVAGTENGVMMVEAGASEVSEETIIDGIDWAFKAMQPAIKLQKELVEKVGVTEQEYELDLPNDDIQTAVDEWVEGRFGEQLRAPYPERNDLVYELRAKFHNEMEDKVGEDDYADAKKEYNEAFTMALHKDVRKGIVEDSLRPDGRTFDEIRPLSSQIGLLPRAHGSSVFTRGVTQALNIVTLAPLSYNQLVDTMERSGERRFIHHYNAPGWTVGEVRRMFGPGRREIGHGYLAERAIQAVLPSEEDFPYMIRSVTEIMSQNGSTSMAATCSSCLALLDAGVPLKRPVSGIAMGLMLDGDNPIIMSDIADAEDFAGDMDFKVTGTSEGITALQMDMKVHGLPVETLRKALEQSKPGRAHILEHMVSIIDKPKELSPYAPRVVSIKINPEKIRDVIGKGGETINNIIAETGAEIDIKDDGTVFIASPDGDSIKKTIAWIESLTEEPEVGKIYEGKVVKIMDFGAFVNIMPGTDGMVHVSEISEKRVEHPGDELEEGQTVKVKLVAIDDRGRLALSIKKAK